MKISTRGRIDGLRLDQSVYKKSGMLLGLRPSSHAFAGDPSHATFGSRTALSLKRTGHNGRHAASALHLLKTLRSIVLKTANGTMPNLLLENKLASLQSLEFDLLACTRGGCSIDWTCTATIASRRVRPSSVVFVRQFQIPQSTLSSETGDKLLHGRFKERRNGEQKDDLREQDSDRRPGHSLTREFFC